MVSTAPTQSPAAFRVLLAALDQRQDQLARVAGIEPSALSYYLSGRRPLPLDVVTRLEMALLVLRVVDSAPPLSDETVARLQEVLKGAGK